MGPMIRKCRPTNPPKSSGFSARSAERASSRYRRDLPARSVWIAAAPPQQPEPECCLRSPPCGRFRRASAPGIGYPLPEPEVLAAREGARGHREHDALERASAVGTASRETSCPCSAQGNLQRYGARPHRAGGGRPGPHTAKVNDDGTRTRTTRGSVEPAAFCDHVRARRPVRHQAGLRRSGDRDAARAEEPWRRLGGLAGD
jgi:hypothetical protein